MLSPMNHRNTLIITLHLIGIICLFLFTPSADAYDRDISRITLSDSIINPVTAEYIETAIDRATKEQVGALIIELDTPGGLISSTRRIVRAIMNAEIPIIVYVTPKGARAGSAGVFITLAANVAAMAPSTNIGAAHPVQMQQKQGFGETLERLVRRLTPKKKDSVEEKNDRTTTDATPPMEEKIVNDTRAWVSAIARERGRNIAWAERAVTESVSITDEEALRDGIIDIIATDFDDLLAQLDGRTVTLPSGEVTLATKNARIISIPMDTRLRWLAILAHPNIAYILLMLGFYGLLFEFTHPGIGFPGIAGAICLVLAFFGLQVLPTNIAGLILILLAIAMFFAEIKITSYGLLTLGGIVTLFLGSLILFTSSHDFLRVSLPIVIAFSLATALIALFLGTIVARLAKRRATTGSEGMVGAAGQVLHWQKDSGTVFVHGEIWNARSDAALEKDDRISVIAIEGMTLVVAKTTIGHSHLSKEVSCPRRS